MWLGERTLLVGRSFRTNDAGVEALRAALPGVDVLAFDVPNRHGPDACLHLLSLLSPLDRDLVVAYVHCCRSGWSSSSASALRGRGCAR